MRLKEQIRANLLRANDSVVAKRKNLLPINYLTHAFGLTGKFRCKCRHGQFLVVSTVIVCGCALPAPTVIAADLLSVTLSPGAVASPTIPFPRAIDNVFVPDTVSAVVGDVGDDCGVEIDVVIVGGVAPALFIVTNTCAC